MKRNALILCVCALVSSFIAWYPQSSDADRITLEQKHLAAGVSAENLARIRISRWDAREMANVTLELQLVNDQWVLPQHYHYPADASERVGALAAALLGIRLGIPLSSEVGMYESYALYDPTDIKDTELRQKGFATRIQMWSAENDKVIDVLIGAAVRQDTSKHYIRLRQGQSVYSIPWSVDVPLHFVDWIDRSLTHIDAADIRKIQLDQYRMNESAGKVQQERGLRVNFTRGNMEGLWNSREADPGKKAFDGAVHALMKTLVAGTFHGVRPFTNDAVTLQKYGLYLSPRGPLGKQGTVSLHARDGITYHAFLGGMVPSEDKRALADGIDYRYVLMICSYDFKADRVRSNASIDTKMKEGRAVAAALNKRFAQYIYIVDDMTYRDMHPPIDSLFMDKPAEQ